MTDIAEPTEAIDHVMLGRFVMQYEEGASGFFVDADEAREVALQVKAALGLGEAIMAEVHADLSIPTDAACKVYQAIKRASLTPRSSAPQEPDDALIVRLVKAAKDMRDRFPPKLGCAETDTYPVEAGRVRELEEALKPFLQAKAPETDR